MKNAIKLGFANNVSRAIVHRLHRNIAIATTFQILVFSLVIAIVISIASFFFIQHLQFISIHSNIKQLASTVETTASIASFTNDNQLAKEVVNGLLNNKTVSAASISSDQQLLFSKGAFSTNPDKTLYQHILYSPFEQHIQIGKLQIDLNEKQAFKDAYQYAKFISIIMFVLIIVISITLSVAINFNIIQPIQKIGAILHAMEPTNLTDIPTPEKHADDEIGRLVNDINLLTKQQKNLLKSEQRLRLQQALEQKRTQMIFEKNSNGLFVADSALNLSVWNSALEQILLCRIEASADAPPNLIQLMPAHASKLQALLKRVLEQQISESVTLHFSYEAIEAWVDITLLILDEFHLQGIVTDVTNHKKSELLALSMAEKDPLTGLLNRRGFEIRLSQMISQCDDHRGMALMMIDLDGFKEVNDSAGHDAGDLVLKEVATRLKHNLRSNEVIARLGGDEFAVIIPNLTQVIDYEPIAQKLLDLFKTPVLHESSVFTLGASIGVVFNTNPHFDSKRLLKQADYAMYQVKHTGKGRFFLSSVV